MAHGYIHLAAGMYAGAAIGLMISLYLKDCPWHASSLRRSVFWSYGLGIFALIPHMALEAGVLATPPTHFAWNICVLYPVISTLIGGGMLKGQCLVFILITVLYCFAFQQIPASESSTENI